jgi:membrane-associated protease RseP (regulator of RpoE activity)
VDSLENTHPTAGVSRLPERQPSPQPRLAAGRAVAGRASRLSAGRIFFHLFLLAATFVTTTIMGTLLSVDAPVPDDAGLVGVVLALFGAVLGSPEYIASGLIFSFTLLVILGAHELGHYFACRYYGIDATLPYFLPAPPPILIGTFGAFIKIKSPFPNRRALFDVGVAGPIAGFCFAIPAAIVGLKFAAPAFGAPPEGGIIFHDPLLFVALGRLLGLPHEIAWNPIYFAAWIGMFATGLNLIPVGQLDGGHALYALLGHRGHRVVSAIFFAVVMLLATVSFVRFDSPVWFLYVVFLAFLAFRSHPPTMDSEPDIGPGRRLVAAIVTLIFLLSFLPFPITVN